MDSVKTEKITIWGVVQGVGFRPFAAKLADAFGMKGEIRNRCGLVEIMVTDRPQRIGKFLDALRRGKPAPAEIVRIDREAVARRDFEGFLILESGESGEPPMMLPADLAVCDDCLAEMDDPENPRYMHPFISCVACGPRYTIMDDVPYDRGNTSMADFDMCPFCAEEYADRENRRYHAQTVSCHRCGPVAVFEENGNFSGGSSVSPEAPLLSDRERDAVAPLLPAVREIAKGGVVALKGAGGYYFVCSPFLEEAALRLREIKARDKKPFAVMFPDLETVKVFCCAGPEEETLLTSGARPIVLLERRAAATSPAARVADEKRGLSKYGRRISQETCGNSRCIGAFLPGMGLQRILTAHLGPLIMTSANLSGLPMIKDDDEMRRALKRQPLLSGMLYN
ncbi:MAG: Sua5/YciO/YrdC/YwlC family protein, partial [Clostridiales Family XIII bacterium]|nr:Sua5/YciO/YrdC/YwlC family protein [Clostridiales Family XIII bacterium]